MISTGMSVLVELLSTVDTAFYWWVQLYELLHILVQLWQSNESRKIENSALKTDIIEASDVKRILENEILLGIGY